MSEVRWEMSIQHIILAIFSSTYQKLLKLMEICQTSDRNNFAQFFLRQGVEGHIFAFNIIVSILYFIIISSFVCIKTGQQTASPHRILNNNLISACTFGVRIVPLYPPACRKRRLRGGGVSNDNIHGH